MPSPTIATLRPCALSWAMKSALLRGDWLPWAWAASMPSALAMCDTVAALSPLRMYTLMPCACRRAMASALSGLSGSARANAPAASPLMDTATRLAICQMSFSGCPFSGCPCCQTACMSRLAKSGLPTFTKPMPATCACKPAPASVSGCVAVGMAMPRSAACDTMALASGWAACCSTAAAA